jgi:hypothetical protein
MPTDQLDPNDRIWLKAYSASGNWENVKAQAQKGLAPLGYSLYTRETMDLGVIYRLADRTRVVNLLKVNEEGGRVKFQVEFRRTRFATDSAYKDEPRRPY